MTVPYTFTNGTDADATEVNANSDYFENISIPIKGITDYVKDLVTSTFYTNTGSYNTLTTIPCGSIITGGAASGDSFLLSYSFRRVDTGTSSAESVAFYVNNTGSLDGNQILIGSSSVITHTDTTAFVNESIIMNRDWATGSYLLIVPTTTVNGYAQITNMVITGGTNTLSENWAFCNGQIVSDVDSPLYGYTLPNLNGWNGATKRFTRGSPMSGGTGGAETHYHSVTIPSFTNYDPGTEVTAYGGTYNTSTVNHLPPYYEVQKIIRIK